MQIPRPTRPPVAWASDFFTFGVTGTNGKTSTVHLLASVIAASGEHGLAVSTVGYFLDGVALPLSRSAQGFVDALIRLRDAGGRWAAVECTSKSLAEGYAKRWRFDLGVFTNLSADHLQTHGSWEHYLASKAQLFTHLGPGRTAVLNAADRHSLLLDRVIPADVERRYFGSPTRGPLLHRADLAAASVFVDGTGTHVQLRPSPWAEALGGELRVRLVGEVFAENALAAACAGLAAGLDPMHVVEGLARCTPVMGRFEVVARDPLVVIDYAHSPDALARTCDTARQLVDDGQVIVVFGAGGESTPGKRLPMGEAVGSRADVAVVTNDNPRGEDPQIIAEMLMEGLVAGGRARIEVCLDRREAIERALERAGSGDVVVVAGKGHESGQEVEGQILPFSDHDVVRRLTGGLDA
ncbi:Mur ligase family protein [Paraliomyxa miuraensis]|uniref:Mur ligase family protein n=1 Tax=Paraliomyxa miuraensis TaxID=376150 RepID=UPI00225B84DF|nr:UDP-N-acetylmuramyl-tripeptide synthetase [Paraliomyxa miuraensis]MCX4244304.1 UDP-N-acetylmuramyl-tripeptide synthetase [Paraliomyxa miuraensis]